MMLKQKYSREDFLEFQKQFLPDFKKDIRRVTSSGLKVTENVVLLGQSEQLDLHIFEFTHRSTTDARVSLAADGFKVMKDHAISQALAVYQSESSDDWRLSLMTATLDINPKGRVTQTFSNPKRYSFFLGPEAKIRTPEEFLIKRGKIKSAQDLISRFDVEVVTKEFFQKYNALFENLQKFLIKDHAFTVFAEKNNIDVDAFAKKILGQIVFCYFLQKKGWLGAAKGEDINKGDKDFMRSLFIRSAEKKENFYNDHLEPLFYESLNAAPEEDGDFYRIYLDCQIPFLNGGLFEPLENYDWKKSFLHIPDTMFSNKKGDGILDVFDLYNFTVYEDDPVDREVSVDPEMLGKAFENLLPENIRKGQGAYYTPREIVHYMCQESLINHLISETGIGEKEIRKLIASKEHLFTSEEGLVFSSAEAEKLDRALANIKVCDPACGSGAFLVGMLHEVVMARRVLNPKKHEYRIKKEAIQNSIYGVDIDPGAVEIAKLRLWLSLVVDYELEDIEPLPNLDYKIMCGNSLLEELIVGDEAIKLFDERLLLAGRKKFKTVLPNEDGSESARGSSRENQLQELLSEKQKGMLSLNNQGKLTSEIKRKLDKEIAEILKELAPKKKIKTADRSPGLFAEKAEEYFAQLRELQKQYFSESNSGMKKRIRKQIEQIELEFIRSSVQEKISSIEAQIKNANLGVLGSRKKNEELIRQKLEFSAIPDKIKNSKSKPYFLWKLNFFEVFQEKDGFDVVIANPPYIDGQGIEISELKMLKTIYASAEGKTNFFNLFQEKAQKVLKLDGISAFIIPTPFLRNGRYWAIRDFLLNHARLVEIVDFEEMQFESAVVESILLFVQKRIVKQSQFNVFKNLERGKPKILEQETFNDGDECKILTAGSEVDSAIISKARKGSLLLEDVYEVRDGISTGFKPFPEVLLGKKSGKMFISLDGSEEVFDPALHKRIIDGGEFNKYTSIDWEGRYIKYDKQIEYKPKPKEGRPFNCQLRDREIFERNPKICSRQTSNRLIMTLDEDGFYTRNSVHNIYPKNGELKIKYILALLNSRFLNYIYVKSTQEIGKVHPQVHISDLRKLPIKKGDLEQQSVLIGAVDKIFSLTRASDYSSNMAAQAKVQEYEQQIDREVYKLYSLSQDEIKIVEEATRKQ